MKNLIVSKFSEFSSECKNCFCLLNDEDAVYLVSTSTIYKLVEGKVSRCFSLDDVSLQEDEIVSAVLLGSLQLVYCVTRGGSICLYNTSDCSCEVAGEVDGGLCEVAVSPDDEVIALVSGRLQLLIMDSQLQPVAEKSLVDDEAAKLSPVNVGWGSKQTQFHGSAGKAAARDVSGAGVASVDGRDRRDCSVTWRSDGLMLCVSYVCPQNDVRCYSIYSRDCQLLARAERVTGCSGSCVSWQPADSRLVTASLQLPSQQLQVVFYEKNGLRHGEFTLNYRPAEAFVLKLLWSPCSSVLAVWLQLNGKEHSAAVQLWTSSNYHWRLKRELMFSAGDDVAAVSWHPDQQLCMQILSISGRLSTVCLRQAVSVCETGWSAVINSSRVLVSPLSVAVLPPPMSAQSLHLPTTCCVTAVVFGHWSRDSAVTRLYVVTASGYVYMFSSDARADPNQKLQQKQQQQEEDAVVVTHVPVSEQLVLVGSWQLDGCENSWCWSEARERSLVACCPDGERSASDYSALVFRLVDGETAAQLVNRVTLLSPMHLSAAAGEGTVLFQSEDGSIQQLNTSADADVCVSAWRGADNRLSADISIKSPLMQMCVVGGDDLPLPRALLSLCSRRQLRLDSSLLLSSCSSFAVNDQFLLAITLDHRLHCVLLSRLLGGGWQSWTDLAMCRSVERGALLVSAPVSTTCVVLQMPRGNLEVVHPRPLVLCHVGRFIDSGDYYSAYELMRRHRVNLNLLVDYDPDKFCLRCSDICRELSRQPNWLCVLLAELREEDVTQTMFGEWFPSRGNTVTAWNTVLPDAPEPSKVNSVCALVRSCLEQQLASCPQLMLPLITSWVCQQPADVQSALQLILSIKEQPGVDVKEARESALPLDGDQEAGISSELHNDIQEAGVHRAGDQEARVNRSDQEVEVRRDVKEAVVNRSGDQEAEVKRDVKEAEVKRDVKEAVLNRSGDQEAVVSHSNVQKAGVSLDAALRYLLYLVKPQRLYDEALSTYNFDLVLMVAERTDKDPKEYLPFLNELRALPVPYRHYRIDRHLRRHTRALRHLANAGETHQREALQYVQQQSLHLTALSVYEPGSAGYKAVCALYADLLAGSERTCWEAGIFYKRAGVQMSAVDVFRRALAWRDCLQTALAAGLQREEFRALCLSLADSLSSNGRHCDAAAIYERHLRMVDKQVECLVQARSWLDAVLACQQAGKSSLLESLVLPALLEAVSDTERIMSEIRSEFCSHLARLESLREKQALVAAQILDGAVGDCDLYSDTSSVSGSSTSSGRSSRSGRSRRKQERKKYSMREGSASEDLALIAACHTLASRCYSLREEVSSLLRALLLMASEKDAASVQKEFSRLLVSVDGWCRRVWPSPPQPLSDPEVTRSYHALCDRLAKLDSVYRIPPISATVEVRWKLECVNAE